MIVIFVAGGDISHFWVVSVGMRGGKMDPPFGTWSSKNKLQWDQEWSVYKV